MSDLFVRFTPLGAEPTMYRPVKGSLFLRPRQTALQGR